MTDTEVLSISERLYSTINSLLFNGTLPEVVIKLENENSQYVGLAGFDIDTVIKRLDEIRKRGEATTDLRCVLTITRIHILDDYLSTLIALADTILHEAVHYADIDGIGHGDSFKQLANAHGLEIVTDEKGNYIDTRIKADTAIEILKASGLIKRK